MGLKQKCSAHFKESPILPFSDTILLRCMWASGLVNKASVCTEVFHVMVHVFSPIVRSKDLRFDVKLGDNHVIEFSKSIKYL
jgi:hypothetical protein